MDLDWIGNKYLLSPFTCHPWLELSDQSIFYPAPHILYYWVDSFSSFPLFIRRESSVLFARVSLFLVVIPIAAHAKYDTFNFLLHTERKGKNKRKITSWFSSWEWWGFVDRRQISLMRRNWMDQVIPKQSFTGSILNPLRNFLAFSLSTSSSSASSHPHTSINSKSLRRSEWRETEIWLTGFLTESLPPFPGISNGEVANKLYFVISFFYER